MKSRLKQGFVSVMDNVQGNCRAAYVTSASVAANARSQSRARLIAKLVSNVAIPTFRDANPARDRSDPQAMKERMQRRRGGAASTGSSRAITCGDPWIT
jgi:hypothetical protein